MKSHGENTDQIIRKNFPKDIAFKRVQKGSPFQLVIYFFYENQRNFLNELLEPKFL